MRRFGQHIGEHRPVGRGRAPVPASTLIGAALISAVLVGSALPAVATPAPGSAASFGVWHPQDDYAGSQIAIHEGTTGQNGSNAQDLPGTAGAPTGVPLGLDVSGHQGAIDWGSVSSGGGSFAYIKATEGTYYTNPDFAQQYNGSYSSGLVRGAYHFATPNTTDGVSQADYFLAHGGGWSNDGKTLPPAIDLEYNPYGDTCYGLTPAALVAWIHAFVNEMKAHIGIYPTIYTSTTWWSTCTGNDSSFGADPLWIPRYGSSVGTLPAGWSTQAVWQYADSGTFPGDQDSYNGSAAQLRDFASHG
ncbi:MAG TPA: GH25 family lysozyme [Pseudonocardiaceae bacterium]|nr:GH25 family lysozyme [Pseudonocardiaceae bacterium]